MKEDGLSSFLLGRLKSLRSSDAAALANTSVSRCGVAVPRCRGERDWILHGDLTKASAADALGLLSSWAAS